MWSYLKDSFSLKDTLEECLMGAFLNSLKVEIQAELEVVEVNDLEELIKQVIHIDGKNQMLKADKRSRAYKTPNAGGSKKHPTQPTYLRVTHYTEPTRTVIAPSFQSNTPKPVPKIPEPKPGSTATGTSSTHKSGLSRRFPDSEMAHRRELGLCYKCGERYNPTHTCRDKHFQVFLIDVGPEEHEKEVEGAGEGSENYFDAEDEATRMELSLNSIAGFEGNHTMKVRGSIVGQAVVILVDSKATHNFIVEELLKLPGIRVDEVAEYTITVGDGYTMRRRQRCRDMAMKVQGLNIIQIFYPFPLRGIDVVLGIEWLQTLGEVKVNWRQMTMKIGKKHNRICLERGPTLS